MGDVEVARSWRNDSLYERIGTFLFEQGLSPDPANYAFAHRIVSDPTGPIASRVAHLVDGGFRLNRHDIERLGGTVVTGAGAERVREPSRAEEAAIDEQTAKLVAQTQQQVDGFADMMRVIQAETRGFGLDLAQSAAAITQTARVTEIDQITRITDTMITRIRDTEVRLARATEETDALRDKLAEARDTARRDPLTGLPNRRAFEEAFAGRDPDDAPHCLAVCDVDRFKRINDEHGHGVGDRVLSAIGQSLASACQGHLVVRYGGEEFAVLLKGIGLAKAAALIDTARKSIASKRFRNRDTDTPIGRITFSAGVTAIHAGETAETAFSRADRLLYAAKADGRDRVSAA